MILLFLALGIVLIIIHPSSNISENTLVMIQCSVQDATDSVEIIWYKNEKILIGETGEVLTMQNVSRHQNGVYRCLVKNFYGNISSDVIHLNVHCK